MLRNFLLLFLRSSLLLVYSTSLFATNYYVSPSGDDSNSGTSPASAWKTLTEVNSKMFTFGAGDSILFERGGTYYGFLQLYVSGASWSPLVFAAYGSGDRPVLNAGIPLGPWTHIGGEVYKAPCPNCPSRVNSLYIDGVAQRMGRYPNVTDPNGGYLTIQSASSKWHLTDPTLGTLGFANQYWQGGEVVIRNLRWILDRAKVNNFQNNTVSLGSPTTDDIQPGYGYFFQNHPNTFDLWGEWSYDNSSKEIYLYLPGVSPNFHSVEVSGLSSNIITSSLAYVHFHDLHLVGASDAAVEGISSHHMEFDNLYIYGAGKDGITLNNCDHIEIEHSTIDRTNNNGLVIIQTDHGIFRHNTITHTGLFAGMGENGNGTYTAIYCKGNYNDISFNRIDSMGYNGIRFEGHHNTIKRNFLTDGCLILDDGSGIYTWSDGQTLATHNVIEENIILHVEGTGAGTPHPEKKVAEGIYIDDRSQLVDIVGNTIGWCSDNGILIHNSRQILIQNNTIFKAKVNQLFMLHDDIAGPQYTIDNCTVLSNIMVSSDGSAPSMHLRSNQNDLHNFGSFNYNMHGNPYDSLMIMRAWNPQAPTAGPLTIERYPFREYQQVSGQGGQSGVVDAAYPSFWIKDTLSPERVSNTSFDYDIAGWSCWGNFNNNCNVRWDPNGLDQGAIELGFNSTNGSSYVEAYHYLGQIDSGKTYHLTFTGKGHLDGRRLELTLRQTSWPYGYVEPPVSMPIEGDRREYSYFFIPEVSEANTQLVIRIHEDVHKYWMDNVSLHEVSTDTLNDHFMDMLYNEGNTPKVFALDKGYKDPAGNNYCGSLTLDPFKSVILMDVLDLPFGAVYTGATIKDRLTDANGCEWAHVTSPASEGLASIHPNGLNFGQVSLNTYIRSGTPRAVNGRFVMNRNWAFFPQHAQYNNFTIRLFVTRSEVQNLRMVNPQIKDVRNLWITRYQSPNYSTLNNDFNDNTQGSFNHYSPENIKVLPYENGYYLEFTTDGFGEFWIGGEPIGLGSAFPVEFLDINAEQISQDQVLVSWTTGMEENSSHFVVQRSISRNFWEEVGQVDAAGNSNQTLYYEHEDQLATFYSGVLYYRIKEVDLDGQFTYSDVVSLQFSQTPDMRMEVGPNPAEDKLSIKFHSSGVEPAGLRIVNALGQVVWKHDAYAGSELATLSVKGWVPGIYYVELADETEVLVKKIVVR